MGGMISDEQLEGYIEQRRQRELSDRDERIKQLERQCAVLAAEIDRMRPVVEATITQINRDDDRFSWYELKKAVNVYEAAKEQG